jgi:hypothetical protein
MKLRLIYNNQEFILDEDELTARETEAVEEIGGASWGTFMEWLDKFQRGSFKAWLGGLWLCMRRQDPNVEFDHLFDTIGVKDLEIEVIEEPKTPGKDEPDASPTSSPSPPQASPAE